MIRAAFTRRSDGLYSGFVLRGHSGFSEEGSDIVCSAVSALAVNTVNSIEEFTGDHIIVEEREDGGYLSLRIEDVISPETELLLKSLLLGLKSIGETYGSRYIVIEQ